MTWVTAPHPVLLDIARQQGPQPVDDPSALLASALDHRMGGLLWSRVLAGDVVLDRTTTQQLARIDLWTRGHNRKLWRTARVVSERLADVDVEIALMKGPAVERQWYDREGERPCNDLDVVLRPSDVGRIDRVIEAIAPDHRVPGDVIHLMRTGVLASLDLRVDGVDVDLHADSLKIEVPARQSDLFWSRTAPVRHVDGTVLRALDAETSLVHFLLHLNKDRFARLLGFVDVAQIVRSNPDWEAVADMLRREGLFELGSAILYRVVDVLDLAPPPLPRPAGWRARAWSGLWPAQDMLAGRAGIVSLPHRQLWLPWLAEGRTREALHWWLRRRAFPPAALVRYQLPEARGPYLWRLATGRARRWRARRRESLDAQSATMGHGTPSPPGVPFPGA